MKYFNQALKIVNTINVFLIVVLGQLSISVNLYQLLLDRLGDSGISMIATVYVSSITLYVLLLIGLMVIRSILDN